MAETVVLAYSGGLDTSVAITWLKETYNMDVIAVTGDVGNERDFTVVKEKALKTGAVKALVLDGKADYIDNYVFPALKANAVYEGEYPLATALSRPLIAKQLVEVARKEGAGTIAHGCTGKGNDQVRFEVAINTLAPELKTIAPAREWGMTRGETMDYANRHGIPVALSSASPYSIDESVWGRAVECGVLEDPWVEPPEEVYTWTKSPEDAPDSPGYVEIGFEKGVPVTLDGQRLDGLSLVNRLNELAGEHGVGRIDLLESRLVGIKSREIYEAPAAVALLKAHLALEGLTLSKNQLRFKHVVAQEYADIIYNGLWFSAQRRDLAAYIDSTQQFVTGEVRLKMFKGALSVVGRKSEFSLYSYGLATYDEADEFDQSCASGFIQLWGLEAKTQAQSQPE